MLIQGDEPEEFAEPKYARQDLKVQWDVLYPEEALSIEDLTKLVISGKYDAIGIDSLTTVLGVVARLTLGATTASVFTNRESCYRQVLLAGSADLAFHALACRQTILDLPTCALICAR